MRSYLGIDIDYIDISPETAFPDLQKVKSQHLTLYFWDDLSENETQKISEKIQSYQHKQFAVEATQVYAFPNKENPDLVALQFDSLENLNELRNDVLLYLNLPRDKAFEPHITLYRKQKLDSSFKKSKEFLQNAPAVKVQISNISLCSSNPETGLNKYKLLGKRFLS